MLFALIGKNAQCLAISIQRAYVYIDIALLHANCLATHRQIGINQRPEVLIRPPTIEPQVMKHTRLTRSASISSIRYSVTARGRSVAPSWRVPTGRSSLENASGCMRVPRPAAGITPQRKLMLRPPLTARIRDCDGRRCAR